MTKPILDPNDDNFKRRFVELINSPKAFKLFLEKLPEADREFFQMLALDLESHVELDPLRKFKKNNPKQMTFLDFTVPFQYFIGGNKGGKTATITYKGATIALGKNPLFKRKPLPGKPLINWLCGEDRNVLEQTPLEELTKWLRPDQYKCIKKGTVIDRVRIWPDPQNQQIYSDFIFKPYSSGVDIFESANINGVILCDEEIPEAIFKAMVPRMVAHGAWLMNALTPTHGITYTKDVLEGTGEYAGLMAEGLVQWVEVATEENIENIDKAMYQAMLATYSVYDDDGNPLYNPDGTRKLTAEGEIRLRGKFASVTGKVYPNFKREFKDITWNTFDLEELPDLDTCKFFGFLDYGRRDPFVFCLTAVDENETHWVLEERYQAGLETHQQAEAIREVCDNWGATPLMVVADCQIKDKKARGGTILEDYQRARYRLGHERNDEEGEGEVILGYNFTNWRATVEDKYAPETARAEIGRMLDINPKTGKPYLRFNRLMCPKTIRCIEALQWRKGGRQEGTAGHDDHAEAALRYYVKAGVSFKHWQTSEELSELNKVRRKYRTPNYRPKVEKRWQW